MKHLAYAVKDPLGWICIRYIGPDPEMLMRQFTDANTRINWDTGYSVVRIAVEELPNGKEENQDDQS